MKSKVLVVGGTGYLGKRLVRASLALGHETYVLHRSEIGVDIEKVQVLLGFKRLGAKLVPGSFEDHRSLVEAVKLVDVVICAISGVHIRSHHILLQLKLVDAIKEAGNIKVGEQQLSPGSRSLYVLCPVLNQVGSDMILDMNCILRTCRDSIPPSSGLTQRG